MTALVKNTIANPVTLPLTSYRPEHFLLSVDGSVATVTLNRPDKKNPLTFQSYRELTDFFRACAFDDQVTTIVATGAKVGFLFNKVGLAGCDMGACAILPRIIGQARASELLYTGRFMGAEEGERWGFFSRIVTPEHVMLQAQQLARQIAEGPTFGNTMTKRMLAMEWAMSVEEAIEAEAVAQALCMTTADFGRAYQAFANKVKPVFQGN